ncbi:lytic polysaccharide monooxygenase [Streptomyces sp. NBC_01235]|uniref:lytic polysaccharide monooxygenase n=1 Tax=Streptomyces sp. NBC_01235 TaxID=2903788 RepID=UPI003FA37526
MSARRKAAAVAALGPVPPAPATPCTAPAAAHGSMGDPVSRVSQCCAEGPESPRPDACRAAVAAGGTQAPYDRNGVRTGDADGRLRELIPDGRLCSADNEEFKGLDLARADRAATGVDSGSCTFGYRVTAPHKVTFKVCLTKAGYDPVAQGVSTFSGTLPERSGRQLPYAIRQRSDSHSGA